MLQPLIFPLTRPSTTDVAALDPALRAMKLSQPACLQQRMLADRGGTPPKVPINRPWNAASSRFGVTDVLHPAFPSAIHQLLPYPPTYFRIAGTTKDSTGAALGSCVVEWFDTATDQKLGTVTSDANGLFEFRTAGQPPNAYYLVAYKSGSPDVAGTTSQTLVGT